MNESEKLAPHQVNSPGQWLAVLEQGCSQLNVCQSPGAISQLAKYVRLILKWNKAFNLTGASTADELVTRHVLDSLALVPYINGSNHLDVGTGAGLPGIPLAIALPESRLTLVDSNGKKTRFITQAIGELGLSNVEVHCERIERFKSARCFDSIVSRAVAEIAQLVAWCAPHCCDSGRMVWMKGPNVNQENKQCPPGWHVSSVQPVTVPGLDAERFVVIVERLAG